MEEEWHTLHRIEEVSNLIGFLREYEANTITRNNMRYNNRNGLFNLSFILKIPTFSLVFLSSRIYMMPRFCLRKSSVGFNPGVVQKKNLGVGRGETTKPNPNEVS